MSDRKIGVWETEIRRSHNASYTPHYIRQIVLKFVYRKNSLSNEYRSIYWRSPTEQTDFSKCREKSSTQSDKTQNWRCWCIWLVVGGVFIASLPERVFAQITPDNTLPNNSSVIRDGNIFNINGGTQAGANLFHSFSEFSVPNGGAASFNNAVDIQNIISRVTGGSVSQIDGLIRSLGTANLFLINPKGIIFGQGARLDIGGSFVGTTANAIGFGDRGFFSAIEKNIPLSLLTVNPSALLFNQINQNAAIQNNSVAPAGKDPAGFSVSGLRVPDGKSLLLIGGDINMDGGILNAIGGRVELGSLAGAGKVALNTDDSNLSLSFPDHVDRSNVSLRNSAIVYVAGSGGGSIIVNARNIDVSGEGSQLTSGIGKKLGSVNAQAGDITLKATGEIKVAGSSLVGNAVRSEGRGNAGSINISSNSFSLTTDAQLITAVFVTADDQGIVQPQLSGQGNAGNININVRGTVTIANGYIFSIL
ncbi:filamentous hemagglutinin N-terminal domain-containing protein [Halotia branconii]|uniref:Filamentous hemagglutinin N-terminal domain-containing protein n=1 Tax=Halotia branconii CENA392 TaxID=1539056 RepID=A0AAJ6NTN0_9CYAN|nr:filamentous hemagglutinin N-terminal domain-containing protein [Halotia branconii]WGV26503.1 filamentous hemagglutinin N-terminal domain-containing protein [Halotia branconii CENA392]